MKKKIDKYIEGNYSNTELNEVISILNDKEAEPELEKVMHGYWKKCGNDPIGDEKHFDRILSKVHHQINLSAKQISTGRKVYLLFSKIAAIVMIPLLMALVYYIGKSTKDNYVASNKITVPLGAVSQLTLPDGTLVWLNSGSTFTYPSSFKANDMRLVQLEGEAYFDVENNSELPFIIDMNNLDVKVTGTAFNIRSYTDENLMSVALVEGAVEIGELNQTEGIFKNIADLNPNEVATLNKAKNTLDISQSNNISKFTSWKSGRTIFDNDPIEVVVARFEKLYNVDVVIENDELLEYRFTLTFTNETLERALKILQLSSPISSEVIEQNENNEGVFSKRKIILRKAQ
ncbi:FecR family protein [Saccharicrinis carchari]|uniref:FecR family protein n=1 Tax=Saccharicrinis carchari TaxID=1168039 RepID=A0A521B5P0_SACCC|nr:FecR family protein [Saccharicrinis carchari]SMO42376.1 FecR family protein [Saccharicrinis carchari]